ncbi:MAG: hypothetical protein K6G24_07265 [Lachnospiraceae bacterium]|nr:hypothetical protein [Lachnospiraceae bacterium]
MRYIRLIPGEFLRLVRSRISVFAIVLTVISPILGICFYKQVLSETMQSIYIANPSIAGGIAGFILFGLLTIYEYDRLAKTGVDRLTDSVVSKVKMTSVRLFALLLLALLTIMITILVWLPASIVLVGDVFTFDDFFSSYLIFMGTSIIFGILSAASCYNIFCRFDLSAIILIAEAVLSLTVWKDKWQLCLLNPLVDALSDDFSNHRVFMSVAYMKMCWMLAIIGISILSGLCIRKYGKSLTGSFLLGVRKVYKPVISVLLLTGAVLLYIFQPMVDKSNLDLSVFSFNETEYLEDVLCTGYETKIVPDVVTGKVSGSTVFRITNYSQEERTAELTVTPGYEISSLKANDKSIPFSVDDYQEFNAQRVMLDLPADEKIKLEIGYSGFLREESYASSMQGRREISRRFICLENENITPGLLNIGFDYDVFDRSCDVILPVNMKLVSFGEREDKVISENDDGTKTWRFSGDCMFAGDYIKEDVETLAGNVSFYYGAKHKEFFDEIGVKNVIKTVMDYCTEKFGCLNTLSENGLKLIENRLSDSGYAGYGASTMDESDFTKNNMKDTSKGATGGEVMIHELVHQWWGLGRMCDEDDNGWSAEGLTVYTSYRIAKELYGEEYARENYINMWKENLEMYHKNFYVRNPEYMDRLSEEDRDRIICSLYDLIRYDEMPLKILKAEQLVGGEEVFDEILYGLFNSELDPENPYLTYEEFLNACGLREEELELEQNIWI